MKRESRANREQYPLLYVSGNAKLPNFFAPFATVRQPANGKAAKSETSQKTCLRNTQTGFTPSGIKAGS